MQKVFIIGLLAFLFFNNPSVGQTLNGMSTGNYAGIAGLNFNPASIVDSRFKFDLNIAGGQYFFNNNYLLGKPLIFAKRMLRNDPYNSSFDAVKKDLLKPIEPAQNGVVKARQNAEFQLPLSFMLTTGKRSAIAINLRNRYELTVDNLNPQTASMFYNELNDKANLGVAMNNDGFANNFMNWQEIGFTYGRVLINANKHFIKAAITAKWLGGNAASFIQADELSVTFKDPHTMTLSSPRIQYARTARADFDLFSRREMFSNLEAQSVGWDAGIVYEFRGRIGNFKYADEDYTSRLRRDKNKYTLRLGVALNDIGRLEYNRLPLTRNHSANINNWDFSPVKAHNLREWDTAYSKMVNYLPGQDSTFSVRLPTAFIANADLHLFGGFYVNAAIQRSFAKLAKETTTTLYAPEWFAITPRFETRHFGLYIPFLIREEVTQIGATVRLGPIYVGSNNLLALVQNSMVPSADIHAGFRIPIGYGKPTRLTKVIEKSSGLELSDEFKKELDDTKLKQTELEKRIIYLEGMMDNAPTVIVNNYITDSLGKQQVQTQVSQPPPKAPSKTWSAGPTYTQEQVDNMKQENEKMRKEVEKQMKKEGIEPPKNLKEKKQKKGKETKDGTVSNKKAQKAEKRYQKESEQYNRAVEDELRRMRRQQTVTSTAMVGAVTANTIVDANNNAGTIAVIRDTIEVEKVKTDTIYLRDTIRIPMNDTVPKTNLQPTAKVVAPAATQIPELRTARIFFASGSAIIGKNYTKILNNATAWMLQNPDKKVLLSGVTDATGSPQSNRRLAQQRIDAVKKAFELRGIDVNRFEEDIQVSDIKTNASSSNMRRVDIRVIQ